MTEIRIWSAVKARKMVAIAPKEAVKDAILDATDRLEEVEQRAGDVANLMLRGVLSR